MSVGDTGEHSRASEDVSPTNENIQDADSEDET